MQITSQGPVALALVGLIVFYGCGEDAETNEGATTAVVTTTSSPTIAETPTSSATASAASASFNDTDVFFVELMIPHSQQAVAMASLADFAGASPDVLALADRIKAAHGAEILVEWLNEWGEGAPGETGATDHGAMGHERMPGMMTDEELAALGDARGADFDSMFLTAMIAHHNGAVLIASVELAGGLHPDTLDLATELESDQLAEITQMEEMLGQRS